MGSGNETKSSVRASERDHEKEAWLGDADRVGQKMTHPLWRPGYGPGMEYESLHIIKLLKCAM